MLSSPLPGECTAGLDVPLVVFDWCQLKALGDFGHSHAAFNILLVSKDQQSCFPQILQGRNVILTSPIFASVEVMWQFSVYFLLTWLHTSSSHWRNNARAFLWTSNNITAILRHTYFMRQHSIEFFFGHGDPLSIRTVHHHNDKLCRERCRNNNHND